MSTAFFYIKKKLFVNIYTKKNDNFFYITADSRSNTLLTLTHVRITYMHNYMSIQQRTGNQFEAETLICVYRASYAYSYRAMRTNRVMRIQQQTFLAYARLLKLLELTIVNQ